MAVESGPREPEQSRAVAGGLPRDARAQLGEVSGLEVGRRPLGFGGGGHRPAGHGDSVDVATLGEPPRTCS